VKAWFDFLKVFESTPTDETSKIMDLYEQSDKCRFFVPCPHCGHYQVLRFFVHKEGPYAGKGGVSGLRDENDNWLTADEARRKAFYVCEQGCRIKHQEKDDMVRQGVWLPEGCKVGTNGAVTGTPKRSKRRRGFGEMCSLYADTVTLGQMAVEYLEARDDPESMRSFINLSCGLRYVPPTKTPKGHELWRRLRGNHRRGKVPAGALFLTAGVDGQDDCTYWVVRAWGEGGTSWLVDWGRCPKITDEEGKTRPDSHLTQLRGLVIEKDWPLIGENPVGHETLRPLKVGVDCGHNPLEVHNFVRRFHSDLVLTVAGDAAPPKGQKYSFSVVEKNTRTGKPYPGGLKRWALNTDFYKMDLIDRWLSPLDEGGAWWVTDSAWDEIQTYMRQITNEGRETVKTRTGHTKTQWRILAGNIGNHYWDCEVYARALADMVVGGKWENLTARFRGAKEQRQEREKAKKEPKPGFVRTKSGGSFLRR
jgi:phage terminase large subunit GpA-like protein